MGEDRILIHLASAWSVGDELKKFATYDARLADAARAGMEVVAPPDRSRSAVVEWSTAEVTEPARQRG
jgi:hypothetical protein